MSVFTIVEKEISNAYVSELTVRTGYKIKQISNRTKAKTSGSISKKAVAQAKLAKNHIKKEVVQKQTYVEEAVSKNVSWNIYTGNPGYYDIKGDTVYFGTVTTRSDSAFLESQRTIVAKTIKPYGIVGKELVILHQDWVLGFILILWVIFASVRAGFPQYLGQIFVSTINLNAATRLFRQRGYKTMYGAVRLDSIFHLVLPLSVFQIAGFFKIDVSGYPQVVLFLALLLIINGYFFTKILLYRLVGSIAMLKEQTEESVFNIKLYYKVLGLLLLPVVTVHAILSETNFITVWVMAGLIFIMYIAAIFRSIFLGHQKDISIFYLILYLCALEILPLLLIYKLVSVT